MSHWGWLAFGWCLGSLTTGLVAVWIIGGKL